MNEKNDKIEKTLKRLQIEKTLKRLQSKNNTLKENIDEKTKIINSLQERFDALANGEYRKDVHGETTRLFKTEVVFWGGECSGTQIISVTSDDLKTAKLVEMGFKQMFNNCEIKTVTKKELRNRDDSTWISV